MQSRIADDALPRALKCARPKLVLRIVLLAAVAAFLTFQVAPCYWQAKELRWIRYRQQELEFQARSGQSGLGDAALKTGTVNRWRDSSSLAGYPWRSVYVTQTILPLRSATGQRQPTIL